MGSDNNPKILCVFLVTLTKRGITKNITHFLIMMLNYYAYYTFTDYTLSATQIHFLKFVVAVN